ncbi:MAG TPA: YkvA family protein [Burkholderiales bacterium]|nr:YkvA family protein [Burkholderiales bacterium]
MTFKERARRLRLEAIALGLAARHPDTPWYAKLVVASLVAYVLTPVDFVPDVFPVLGLVDDVIFIPVALALAMRFVPAPVLDDCRGRAAQILSGARVRRLTRLAALLLWLAVLLIAALLVAHAV